MSYDGNVVSIRSVKDGRQLPEARSRQQRCGTVHRDVTTYLAKQPKGGRVSVGSQCKRLSLS